MRPVAPLQVTAEIRALDTGPRLERAFRLTRAIDEAGLLLARAVPFEPGRPVAISLTLPDDDARLALVGRVVSVAPDDEATEGETARPRGIALARPDDPARRRLQRYLDERMLEP